MELSKMDDVCNISYYIAPLNGLGQDWSPELACSSDEEAHMNRADAPSRNAYIAIYIHALEFLFGFQRQRDLQTRVILDSFFQGLGQAMR